MDQKDFFSLLSPVSPFRENIGFCASLKKRASSKGRLSIFSRASLSPGFSRLAITATGTEYVDENGGYLCGVDWFNYPRESVHIKEVYPELWNWLTTDSSYDFADIYDGRNVPANACPAADLGLFEARTIDVTNRKYRAD